MSPAFVQVETTLPSRARAAGMARALVEGRLAACAHVSGPVTSTYRWRGRLETAREWLVVAKTTRARCRSLVVAIENLHPYDTPQVTLLSLDCATRRYADWLALSVTPVRPVRAAK